MAGTPEGLADTMEHQLSEAAAALEQEPLLLRVPSSTSAAAAAEEKEAAAAQAAAAVAEQAAAAFAQEAAAASRPASVQNAEKVDELLSGDAPPAGVEVVALEPPAPPAQPPAQPEPALAAPAAAAGPSLGAALPAGLGSPLGSPGPPALASLHSPPGAMLRSLPGAPEEQEEEKEARLAARRLEPGSPAAAAAAKAAAAAPRPLVEGMPVAPPPPEQLPLGAGMEPQRSGLQPAVQPRPATPYQVRGGDGGAEGNPFAPAGPSVAAAPPEGARSRLPSALPCVLWRCAAAHICLPLSPPSFPCCRAGPNPASREPREHSFYC